MRSVLAFLTLLLGFTVSAYAWDLQPMNKQIDQTSFLVNDNCSATLIDAKKGLLLTAAHCVTDQFSIVERTKIDPKSGKVTKEKVRVMTPGKVSQYMFLHSDAVEQVSFTFKVLAVGSSAQDDSSEGPDLAVLQTDAKLPNTEAAPLACKVPGRGEKVYVVGNTLGQLYATLSTGIVSSADNRDYRMLGVDKDGPLVQTTAPVAGGNSGGAFYNDKGQLFAVTDMGFQTPSPLALGVPISTVLAFLKDHDIQVSCVQ